MTDAQTSPESTPTPGDAYRVLARKYRPATFAELLGQDALVRTLTNALRSGRIAHAFILTGVRGVGKTTTARIVAKALNCVGPDGDGGPTPEPCGVCEPCRAIAEDRHVDVIEMDAASRTGVDDVRELIDGVRYRPVAGRFKVYIIDEVHMLSKNAFNALLKTLEEPPEHVKFIFATTEIRKVPVTVLSRCQRFDLRRLDRDVLADHLAEVAKKEGAEIEAGAIRLIARAADGSVRDGLSMLDQAIAHIGMGQDRPVGTDDVRDMLGLADRGQILDVMDLVMAGDVKGVLERLDAMHRAGADPLAVVQDLMDLTHWLTRLKIMPESGEGFSVSAAEQQRVADTAAKLAMPVLARAWQMLLKGLSEVQAAPAPHTALEMLLVRLAYVSELPAPDDLVRRLSDGAAPAVEAAAASDAPPSESGGAPAAPAGGTRGQARTAPAASPAAESTPTPEPTASAVAQPTSFRDVVALFRERREMGLYGALYAVTHLVSFEPGRIELRPGPNAPADLANRMGAMLGEWTGTRWVVAVSGAPGEPTLEEQDLARQRAEKDAVLDHPTVKAVLDAFPGATVSAVRPRSGAWLEDASAPPSDEEAT